MQIPWNQIVLEMIKRGLIKPPTHGWNPDSAITTGTSIGTEVKNNTTTHAAITDLYFTDFRTASTDVTPSLPPSTAQPPPKTNVPPSTPSSSAPPNKMPDGPTATPQPQQTTLHVIDSATNAPLAGAQITVQAGTVQVQYVTAQRGTVTLETNVNSVIVKIAAEGKDVATYIPIPSSKEYTLIVNLNKGTVNLMRVSTHQRTGHSILAVATLGAVVLSFALPALLYIFRRHNGTKEVKLPPDQPVDNPFVHVG